MSSSDASTSGTQVEGKHIETMTPTYDMRGSGDLWLRLALSGVNPLANRSSADRHHAIVSNRGQGRPWNTTRVRKLILAETLQLPQDPHRFSDRDISPLLAAPSEPSRRQIVHAPPDFVLPVWRGTTPCPLPEAGTRPATAREGSPLPRRR